MRDLDTLLQDSDATVGFRVLDLDSGRAIEHRADELHVAASVFKVPVLVELFRQGSAGELDLERPVPVPVDGRAPGPFGISVMRDQLSASLRDLAWLMVGISDNAATDVICEAVGLDAVNATMRALGLERTRVMGDCRDLFRTIEEDLGVAGIAEIDMTDASFEKVRALDPGAGLHATTATEITRLLQLVWDDAAGSPDACSEVRRTLGLQVWPHRLASGFADLDLVLTSGKTGTLGPVRNEVGVVEYPDGGRYAVAVLVRSHSLAAKQPRVDALIGQAARLGVDGLRS
jgi:beta-lactamase class A